MGSMPQAMPSVLLRAPNTASLDPRLSIGVKRGQLDAAENSTPGAGHARLGVPDPVSRPLDR